MSKFVTARECDAYRRAVDDCMRALRSCGPNWIQVSERIPPHDEIVVIKGGVGYWDGVKKAWFTVTGEPWPGREIAWTVTHWMPMPELPPHATSLPTSKEKA